MWLPGHEPWLNEDTPTDRCEAPWEKEAREHRNNVNRIKYVERSFGKPTYSPTHVVTNKSPEDEVFKKVIQDFQKMKKESDQEYVNYSGLNQIFKDAYNQAANGKGKSRHAENNEKYEQQVACEVGRRLSSNKAAGPLFQAVKKIYESGRLDKDAAIEELLGAINYIAAAIIVLKDGE